MRSVVGVRSDDTVPETTRVLVTTALAMVAVSVTFKTLVIAPPRRVRVLVASAPRFVTLRSVSDSAVARQLVPSAKQTS